MGNICDCQRAALVSEEGAKSEEATKTEAQLSPSGQIQTGLLANEPVMAPLTIKLDQFDLIGYAKEKFEVLTRLQAGYRKAFKSSPGFSKVAEFSIDSMIRQQSFAEFKKNSTGANMQKLRIREQLAIDPAAMLFYEVNSDHIDSSLENYHVVKSAKSEGFLVKLVRFNSKKLLVVSPRHFYFIQVVAKTPRGYVDIRQSIEHAGLLNVSEIAAFFAREKEMFASTPLLAVDFESRNGGTYREAYSEMDMKTGIGLTIARPFLASSFKKSAAGILIAVQKFYAEKEWTKKEKVLWFDDDIEAIERKFAESFGKSVAEVHEEPPAPVETSTEIVVEKI